MEKYTSASVRAMELYKVDGKLYTSIWEAEAAFSKAASPANIHKFRGYEVTLLGDYFSPLSEVTHYYVTYLDPADPNGMDFKALLHQLFTEAEEAVEATEPSSLAEDSQEGSSEALP